MYISAFDEDIFNITVYQNYLLTMILVQPKRYQHEKISQFDVEEHFEANKFNYF
jgi:hypothetical protein